MDLLHIRNFCIIAHIDHGKSTLADRFIEATRTINQRQLQNQMLDNLEIERERGITIKSQVVSMPYENKKTGELYNFNLVDTPGHVDFAYEVSRAIASCEGALLLIDATQGIQAQTIANYYMALEKNLSIIPVINKVDLPNIDIESLSEQIEDELALEKEKIVLVSAKTGLGLDKLFETICKEIPAPQGQISNPLQAVIFDSHYDPFRGVIMHVRLFEGELKAQQEIRLINAQTDYKTEEVGFFRIQLDKQSSLKAGDVGYIVANIRDISKVRVGDTVTLKGNPAKALEGFKEAKPMVFSSLYPVDADQYSDFVKAVEKLKLNDASLTYEKDSSVALGFGFRCGFLGLLHLEIIQERLEREFNVNLIVTAPSVRYRVTLTNHETKFVDNPLEYPDLNYILKTEEPYIRASIILPSEFLGNVISLCVQKRGLQTNMHYLSQKRVELMYEMPLAEVLFDFYDKLKSYTKGYASFDYDLLDYKETELAKLDILLNGESVDVLSMLVYKGNAYSKARAICKKLKDEIPRQQFPIAIQGAIGNHIIARETISAFRKDVIAKCYGGDISRKRKLLEKQKEGKKRMKMVGNIELPQKAFISVLKVGDEK